MVKAIGDYKIPYDDKGNLLHYAGPWEMRNGGTWLDNNPFTASMEIDSMRSGRSAKYTIWTDVRTQREYPMFISDLVDMLQSVTLTKGRTDELTWIVRKRGQNFGLALLETE